MRRPEMGLNAGGIAKIEALERVNLRTLEVLSRSILLIQTPNRIRQSWM